MIFDIHFGDGTTVRAEGKTFHCACIIAQAQRVMYGETNEEQLAVIRGTLVKKHEIKTLRPAEGIPAAFAALGIDLGAGRDVSAVTVRIPDESTTWTFDKSEKDALCKVLNDALNSPGPVKILITKGDEV